MTEQGKKSRFSSFGSRNLGGPAKARVVTAAGGAASGSSGMVAAPRCVSVDGARSDGTVVSATFELVNPNNREKLTAQPALPVRPGDVVSVEHTPRTRTSVLLDRIFRISLGLQLRLEAMWGGG